MSYNGDDDYRGSRRGNQEEEDAFGSVRPRRPDQQGPDGIPPRGSGGSADYNGRGRDYNNGPANGGGYNDRPPPQRFDDGPRRPPFDRDGGGGRGGGGRGGGYGDRGGGGGYGDRGGMRPNNAELGSAARPGLRMSLITPSEAERRIDQFLNRIDKKIAGQGVLPRPKRPGHGRMGERTKITVNHFHVNCNLERAVHYDVVILGNRRGPGGEAGVKESAGPQAAGPIKPLPAETCRQVIKQLAEDQRWPPGIVFDGRKNIYACGSLLPGHLTSYEVSIVDEDSGKTKGFTVNIKWAADVAIRPLLDFIRGEGEKDIPQEAIQALDVALKHGTLLNPMCTAVNRGLFFKDQKTTHTLGNGAELWMGYQQSLRPCEAGLALNVDSACTAFLEESSVLEFMAKAAGVYNVDQLAYCSEPQKKKCSKALIGMKVKVAHMGPQSRVFKVKQITNDGPGRLKFEHAEGYQVTVAQYFEERYGRKLKMLDVPCVNVGTPRKPIYLPVEVCVIAPGQRRLKLDEKQTAAMIKSAAQKPDERCWNIGCSVNEKGALPTDPHVKAFGMEVDKKMMTLDARVLPAPQLMYDRPMNPGNRGNWDMRGLRFNRAAQLTSYAIASFMPENRCGNPRDPGSLPVFMFDLLEAFMEVGIKVPSDDLPEIVYHNLRSGYPGETLRNACQRAAQIFGEQPKIIFVLLPDTGAELYKEVKRASDSFLGIPSQCFVARKASIGVPQARGRPQYCANIAMKANAKLGGVNCSLATIQPFMEKPYMVIGTGVTHPMSFSETEPSIAAVVGSMDAKCSRFSAEVQLQGHRVEIIQDMNVLIKRLLVNFYRNTNGRKPEKLILYRDGVSEGMFNEVQRAEIPQILQACREVEEDYAPPLTFVVCQKRHHTCLFPAGNGPRDRSGNCLPGTVLDSGVTHVTENDFFLLSHSGIQGTSRPAHYHVLLDQNNFTPDELQIFTFHLTHVFCRCTRSVSVCPPAYYASLAASRGRAMLSHYDSASDTESISNTSFSKGVKIGKYAEFASIHEDLATKMFYV